MPNFRNCNFFGCYVKMNKVFKVIVNRITTEKVVVSEYAKGSKKGGSRGMVKKIIAASLVAGSLWGMGVAQVKEHSLYDQYSPSKRTNHSDGSVTFEALSNYKNHAIKINDGGEHLLNNYNYSDTQIVKDMDFYVPTETKNFSQLIDEGSLKVYKAEDWDRANSKPKDGATPLTPEEAKELNKTGVQPNQINLNIADDGTFDFKDDSGVVRTIAKKGIRESTHRTSVNKSISVKEKIPDEPFYQLAFAEVTDGTLTLDSGKKEEVKWDFSGTGIKDSSLFIADSTKTKKNAEIVVSGNTDIDVTFGGSKTFSESDYKLPDEQVSQVSNYTVNEFIHKVDPNAAPLVVEYYDDNKQLVKKEFTIASQEDFDAYNEFIIKEIQSNHLNQEEYGKLVNSSRVFKRISAETLYTLHYKGDGVDNSQYLTEAHKKGGSNSLFNVKGEEASITIEEGAQLKSSGGRVLVLSDKATGVDYTHNVVGGGGNVLVTGESTYTQEGTKVFGYDQADGRYRKGDTKPASSNREQVNSGKYINNGKIFANNQQSFYINGSDAKLSNNGHMHFYSADSNDSWSTLNNISLGTNGIFTNEEGGDGHFRYWV